MKFMHELTDISNDILNATLRIRMAVPSLTETERAIANYVLGLGPHIRHTTISEVAQANGVSEAMIVKLAQKLGFDGYRDLKHTLSLYSQSPVAELHKEINPDDDAETSISKVFSTAIQALQETLSVLDLAQFERAADTFFHARQRNLYGAGGSGIVAQDISHKFLRIGIHCTAYTDAHLMAMSAALMEKGDVAVGVSYSGRTRVVIEALSLARKSGATTIALTNFLNSPLVDCADIVLHSTSRGSALASESVAARIAQLCLIDALFVRVAQRDYSRAMASLAKTVSSAVPKRVQKAGGSVHDSNGS